LATQGRLTDDDMIYQPNLQQGGRFVDAAGDGFIGAGWASVA
jgi:hypothetical protein